MIMAQETRNVDYELMVDKYMNEWEGCNLREFCFNEKVNIYRMLTSDSSRWCLRTFGAIRQNWLLTIRSLIIDNYSEEI